MATELEVLQGKLINTYLRASKLPAFQDKTYFVDGQMQPAFEALWDNSAKLSSGEQIVFEVAKGLWNWYASELKVMTLTHSLSPHLLELTFSLLLAWRTGQFALVKWLDEHKG